MPRSLFAWNPFRILISVEDKENVQLVSPGSSELHFTRKNSN
jgi:hypothetical protein